MPNHWGNNLNFSNKPFLGFLDFRQLYQPRFIFFAMEQFCFSLTIKRRDIKENSFCIWNGKKYLSLVELGWHLKELRSDTSYIWFVCLYLCKYICANVFVCSNQVRLGEIWEWSYTTVWIWSWIRQLDANLWVSSGRSSLRYSGLLGDGDFNHHPYSTHTTQLIFVPFPGGLPPGCHPGLFLLPPSGLPPWWVAPLVPPFEHFALSAFVGVLM